MKALYKLTHVDEGVRSVVEIFDTHWVWHLFVTDKVTTTTTYKMSSLETPAIIYRAFSELGHMEEKS